MTLSVVTDSNEKKILVCRKCKNQLTSRARRGILVKALLFWLPIKRYSCHKCKRKPYVWQP